MKPESRILIVDDEFVIRRLLSEVLEADGYNVSTAENGAAGLQAMRRQPVDLVISDTHMPVMDGPSFVRALRVEKPSLPIIVLNSVPDPDARVVPVNRITAYLSKPFDLDEMRSAIASFGRSETEPTS